MRTTIVTHICGGDYHCFTFCLFSSGLHTEGEHSSAESDDVRLAGGASRCTGGLEVKQNGHWLPADEWNSEWSLKTAAASVRLVNGNSLCSGRVEVKSDQSWSSVCEADFDQQDAEVVCRELGCGAPSVLQGALYGEVEAPMWTKEFQCKGSESSLLDCGSSGSARNTCSPGKAVGLTCSEPHDIRLVGGASRCNGTLEVKHLGDWKPVDVSHVQWNLKTAGAVCRELDCGSAVSAVRRQESSYRPAWMIIASCLQSGSALRECLKLQLQDTRNSLDITCSGNIINGVSHVVDDFVSGCDELFLQLNVV
uniref:SRCR domain-containing protein n=1 Tax=Myripristis murdjan TaxID=586833 RepID=A0A668ALB8_9TELE